jgi:hypothetical protein
MGMKRNESLNINMIDEKKNTEDHLDYYSALAEYFQADPSDTLMKIRSFCLYTPRQVISDFIVKYELFKMVLNIPGSIFEFGVFNGQGLFSFAHFSAILEPNNLNRKIFGFDTFEGFCGIDEKDKKGTSPYLKEGGLFVDSFSRIQKAIELFDQNRFIGHIDKINIIKGDVTKTLELFLEENPHVIASLLYLDMDIYKPTKYVLDKMVSRVPKGGVIAFDEINMKDYPGETIAFLESLEIGTIELRKFPFCSRIAYFVR